MKTPTPENEGREKPRRMEHFHQISQKWLDPEQPAQPAESVDTSEIDDTADIDPVYVEDAG